MSYLERSLFLIIAIVFTTALCRSQCENWDASGKWSFKQANSQNPVDLDMRQNGKAISGSASLAIPGTKPGLFGPGKFGEQKLGKVDGTILGDRFSIEIVWNGGQVGVYNARILPSGRLEGEGYEKSTPNVRHAWNSTGTLRCPPPQPVASSTPPRSTGKPRPTPPKPAADAPAQTSRIAQTPPWVMASQVIFPVPLQPTGFVVVTWDAGPDHPNAQLVYTINNAPSRIPLIKSVKGGQQIPVERGRFYSYFLTDAGQTLAAVNVVAQ